MPAIQLSESVFAELRQLAAPSAATPESVAESLIHAEAERRRVAALPVVVIKERGDGVARIMSPRLANPADARRLVKQIVELPPDAKL